jgi:hypothetical protein
MKRNEYPIANIQYPRMKEREEKYQMREWQEGRRGVRVHPTLNT